MLTFFSQNEISDEEYDEKKALFRLEKVLLLFCDVRRPRLPSRSFAVFNIRARRQMGSQLKSGPDISILDPQPT